MNKHYQNENEIKELIAKFEYVVIPSEGVVEIFQDELGFVHMKVGVCKENWQTGTMMYFVNHDSFHKLGDKE